MAKSLFEKSIISAAIAELSLGQTYHKDWLPLKLISPATTDTAAPDKVHCRCTWYKYWCDKVISDKRAISCRMAALERKVPYIVFQALTKIFMS